MNLLIVDDDHLIRLMVEHRFRQTEFNVITAANGKEALKSLDEQKIDVILLDYELPDIDGLNIVKLLKARPELRTIPIVIMSAHDKLELIGQAYQAGVQLFLCKKDAVLQDLPAFVRTYSRLNKYNEDVS